MGMALRIRPSRTALFIVFSLVLAVAGAVVQRADASHGTVPAATFSATLFPRSVVRGATEVATLTLTNTSSSASTLRLGSANVAIPDGFRVAIARESWGPLRDRDEGRFGSKDWDASVSSGVIHLHAHSNTSGDRDTLKPGQSVTFLLWLVVPCVVPDNSTWTTVAGSSISSPGGDYTSSSSPTDRALGNCSFMFHVHNPQNVGAAILSTVRTVDGFGWPTGAFDGSAAVTGTLGNGPNGTAPVYKPLSFHNGVATGAPLATPYAAETYRTLTVTSGSINGTSNHFDVLVGAADHLAFIQQPTDVDKNATIDPAVTVGTYDAGGNLEATAGNVSLAIGNDPVGGTTLGGTATQPSVAGVATFNDLTLDQSGDGFKLTATSGSLSVTSDPFNVNGGTTFCNGTSTCTASNSDGSTTVETDGIATISFGPPGEFFPGCSGQDNPIPAIGSIADIVPGEGYTAANPLFLNFIYPSDNGNGDNLPTICISKDFGTTYQPVPDCPVIIEGSYADSDLPCISSEFIDGGLHFTLLLTSTDPFAGTG
jgi:hypothetical protein